MHEQVRQIIFAGLFDGEKSVNLNKNKMETKIARLSVTEKAFEVIRELEEKYGALMFYQAGGWL